MRLQGRVAIITGGAAGIGRSMAIQFGVEGAAVVVADIDERRGRETVNLVMDRGGKAFFFHADVSDVAQVDSLLAYTLSNHGRLDVLVNNAAVISQTGVLACSPEEWDWVIKTNLRGTFLCAKAAIPSMRANPTGGAIINMASIGAVLTIPERSAYCASKGGIVALTRQMALDFGPWRIRVNAIAPGAVDAGQWHRRPEFLTDPEGARHVALERHPLCRGWGELVQPTDVAKAAVFLASDDARMITGVVLLVDGGRALL